MRSTMRGCAASASSTTGISRHLSNAVHGCDSPKRTTEPTGTSRSSAAGQSKEGVLVVERGDLGLVERAGVGARYPLRHRQSLVER